jgi:tetratricopeptide (TPR) repeat protein
VALDSWGAEAAERWIQAAKPTHPALLDRQHLVARLYDMVNVPTAVWINETGTMVRPGEVPGLTNDFRKIAPLFKVTPPSGFKFPPEGLEDAVRAHMIYLDAVRDWVRNGEASRFALSEEEVRNLSKLPNDTAGLAAAYFQLGEHLLELGFKEDAIRHLRQAANLRPESWRYFRQALSLEDPLNEWSATSPEFWKAIEALGDKDYYSLPPDIFGSGQKPESDD